MSEATDQPGVEAAVTADATAGVDAASTATTTETHDDDDDGDRMPGPADDDEAPAEAGEGDGATDPDKPAPATESELVEVEAADGTKHKVPAALKEAFLFQADYTKKTQTLAEQARALQAERSTWETQQAESRVALPAEHAKVVLIEHQLSEAQAAVKAFDVVDWDTFRAQAAADPEAKALYDETRSAFNAARDKLADLGDQSKAAKDDLNTKETERRLERERGNANVVKEADAILARDVPGWSPELVTTLAAFADKELGVSPGELKDTVIGADGKPDVRFFKGLALLYSTIEENKTLKADLAKARSQRATAENHEKAQAVTPAVAAKGSGASARDPATPRGDALSTKEWMARRSAQKAAKAR